MRRGPLLVVILVAACAAMAGLGLLLRITPEPRTVVLVTLDTFRADRLGALGRVPSITPRLDRLAASGAVFENAWTVAPVTVPAHATMLTGRLPSEHGLRTNRGLHRLAPAELRPWSTVAEAMRSAGCRTGAFISASVLRADRTGLDAGFDVYDEVAPAAAGSLYENERRGEETVGKALAWLRSADRPAFLWVHLFDAHAPYDAPPPWGAGAGNVTTEKGYDGEVSYVDRCVGELLDGLAAAGMGDAAVVVVADHGEGLGEHGERTHGYLLHEATIRVPLVVAAPGVVQPGTRRAEPVSVRDVAPTLLALAKAPFPENMPDTALFGRSASRTSAGGPSPVYAETLYAHDAFRWAQSFALRIGDWKIVDSGSEVLEFDLAADRAETSPVRTAPAELPRAAGGRPVSPADALAAMRQAATGEGAPTGAPVDDPSQTGYLGGAGGGGAILAEDENRKLPSAWSRIRDLPLFEAGQSFSAAGAHDRALAQFDEFARRQPDNPQAEEWRGRALLALRRPGLAGRAFRRALDLGLLDSRCVEQGLQAWAQAAATDAAAADEGLALAVAARGRGVRDTPRTALLELALHLGRGDLAKATECLERAKRGPRTPAIDDAIRNAENVLRNASGGGGR